MKNSTIIALIVGIIILVNILAQQFFFRLDLTEGKEYTLSRATKDIVQNLNEPVTIKAYFSEDMPTMLVKGMKDFKEMLYEYNAASKGMVGYEFISPSNQQEEQEAMQSGVMPQQIQVRKNNELKVQAIFSGAVIQMGDRKEVLPFISPGSPIEYPLSRAIKKLSVVDKPSVGIIQGHGEPSLQQMQGLGEALNILYTPEPFDLNAEATVPIRFRTIAMLGPKDSIPPDHFSKLDEFLSRGGNLIVAADRVNGDLNTAQGTPLTTGLETWLSGKGIDVEGSFIVDANCGSVSVSQQGSFFRMQVRFPYFPMISNFADHPITAGLEAVMLPFASPIRYTGGADKTYTPIAFTSDKAGTLTPPIYFDVNKNWAPTDFPMGDLAVGAVLEGNLVGDMFSRLVVFSDGEFMVAGGGSDNQNLLLNSVDWLSDDTGLIDLRTKGVTSRPIKSLEPAQQNFRKYLNFLLPILLVLGYGVYRSVVRRNRRTKRMMENYG